MSRDTVEQGTNAISQLAIVTANSTSASLDCMQEQSKVQDNQPPFNTKN